MESVPQQKKELFDHSKWVNLAARIRCTEAEGPGKRYALWVQGCPFRCVGCCNPHMLSSTINQLKKPKEIIREIERAKEQEKIEGITLIGGEPFAQAGVLTQIAKETQMMGLSVMVFTGFTLSNIRKKQKEAWNQFLKYIDLLVDGTYEASLHTEVRRWIGSSNQKVHFLTDRYAHLQKNGWEKGHNTIEIRFKNDEISINGFPHQDITKVLALLASKTIEKKDRTNKKKEHTKEPNEP